ncbi:MAG TPA: aminopeptidase [Kouleothrix sp.]|uniref:aminopeptidase n=1 Tax=Kouleothrix sp. TaxID=2779161 RepID=UPI002CB74B81|nr:aminopeptidase [Kouleothrix sp.]HRC77472.1 aminopeptidase [Kouleothrix sp.]
MPDPRVAKLARVLVRYSLGLKEGQLFQINADAVAAPLVRELYRETLEVGALPLLRLTVSGIDEIFYAHASEKQLTTVTELARQENEAIHALIGVLGSENTKALSNANPQKIALRSKAARELRTRFYQRVDNGEATWAVTQFPTQSAAQDADMSLAEYEDFVYGAGKLDHDDPVAAWRVVHDEQQRLADILAAKRVFRIVGPDTDLTYDTGGRSWINADGKKNFPDGEVFTSPDETKTEGHIRFSFPAVYAGREVSDVRLEFREGKVVKASAARGEDLLHKLIDMDEGARRLGEAAFGTNYQIQRFTRNILFDEKIGGTIHLALGDSFREVGGQNRSALHWDMVCDLRQGGEAYADGQLIYKDGKFVI